MKIVDGFIFFNEIDILKKRLEYMYKYVDYFIIVESPTTFTGKNKPFNFENRKEEFQKWMDKIIYIKSKPLNKQLLRELKYQRYHHFSNENWLREATQRIVLEKELEKFSDDDMIIFSDVDEIPDMEKINFYEINEKIVACKQQLFIFSIDYMVKTEHMWNGTIICKNKHVKNLGLVNLRENRNYHECLGNIGWHFTKFGGDDLALDIYNSSSHAGEYNYEHTVKNKLNFDGTALIKTPDHIKNTIPVSLKDPIDIHYE